MIINTYLQFGKPIGLAISLAAKASGMTTKEVSDIYRGKLHDTSKTFPKASKAFQTWHTSD